MKLSGCLSDCGQFALSFTGMFKLFSECLSLATLIFLCLI